MSVTEATPATVARVPVLQGAARLTNYWVSGGVHLFFLGLLSLAALPAMQQSEVTGIQVSHVDVSTEIPESSQFGEAVDFSSGGGSGTPTSAADDLLDSVLNVSDSSDVSIMNQDSNLIAFSSERSSSMSFGEKLELHPAIARRMGTGGTSSGMGRGTGVGDGEGDGVGKRRFFSIRSKGKDLVFVVDASRSMNLPHPGEYKTRFNRVQFELYRTIMQMTEEEKFFIIYFGDDAYPMPANLLTPADEGSKNFYLQWMSRATAESGSTRPLSALLLAISLKPDAVYFLTDGEFESSISRQVTEMNKGRIPIHTIGFEMVQKKQQVKGLKGNLQLQDLAEMNGGTYFSIPLYEEKLELQPQ